MGSGASMTTDHTDRKSPHGTGRLSWFLGAALLAAVVAAALHFSEERAFVRLAERAEPLWLVVALLLQAGTYVAQGAIWRRVGAAAGYQLTRKTAFGLGLAKLFADQALPSAGVSSSILIAKALEQRQVPPAAVKASVLINIASYHLAYVMALTGALAIVAWRGHTNTLVVVTAVLFLLFSLGLSTAVLVLSGHRHERLAGTLGRGPGLRTMFDFLADADARLVRSPRMLGNALGLQAAIVLLDAATMWTLIRALGVTASASDVFASFMIASLFRTMGIIPGGLGTFEATSVLMLRMVGVDLAVALAATLLFRGLSFWLPMLPGYWFSRRAMAPRARQSRQSTLTGYWALEIGELAQRLGSGAKGLSEAAKRLRDYGPNELRARRPSSRVDVLIRQLRSPLLLLLVFAAGASVVTGEWLDAAIVVTIVTATVGIGYSSQPGAGRADDGSSWRPRPAPRCHREPRQHERAVHRQDGHTHRIAHLEGAYDGSGQPSQEVLDLGASNAALETGIASPLDEAITNARQPDLTQVRKLGEIPFDFVRKRISVVVQNADAVRLISKGAFHQVLDVCTRSADGTALSPTARTDFERRYDEWTGRGIRVLAVAARPIDEKPVYSREDERDMTFMGFLTFLDPPKEGVADALTELAALGVTVKLVTGDSRLVAQHVATLVGMRADRVLTGQQLDDLHDEALWHAAEKTDLFVEVDPNQKERIILSLKKMGHVIGFLGDGVNDAPAMHAADTSLSVEGAVDVAREAADFVLLERSLDVIRQGIEEGRKTFANTLKYILMTTSANLGNMVSMAAVSLFLPFLPLTAGQILLNNFLSDVPAVGIADDSVDRELVDRPRRWDIKFIGRYMVEFGILSSVFDFLMFGALLGIFRAGPATFRTGWFVESLLTELVVALVMRTRRPFFRSRPGALLLTSTVVLIAVAFVIPYLPFADVFGFVRLPGAMLGTITVITVLYVAATELQKKWFYRGVA